MSILHSTDCPTPAPPIPPSPEAVTAKALNPAALTYLIVDDQRFCRTMIKAALRNNGIGSILEAGDAAEAFELIVAPDNPVDFILVDLDMPILSGAEFTRIVRRGIDVPNPEVPIIMVSGFTAEGLVMEALNAGVHEFVAKPFSADMLFGRIVRTLAHPRPFVRTKTYIGPERRDAGPAMGPDRRQSPDG